MAEPSDLSDSDLSDLIARITAPLPLDNSRWSDSRWLAFGARFLELPEELQAHILTVRPEVAHRLRVVSRQFQSLLTPHLQERIDTRTPILLTYESDVSGERPVLYSRWWSPFNGYRINLSNFRGCRFFISQPQPQFRIFCVGSGYIVRCEELTCDFRITSVTDARSEVILSFPEQFIGRIEAYSIFYDSHPDYGYTLIFATTSVATTSAVSSYLITTFGRHIMTVAIRGDNHKRKHPSKPAIFVNGCLYWLVQDNSYTVQYNVELRQFQVVESPNDFLTLCDGIDIVSSSGILSLFVLSLQARNLVSRWTLTEGRWTLTNSYTIDVLKAFYGDGEFSFQTVAHFRNELLVLMLHPRKSSIVRMNLKTCLANIIYAMEPDDFYWPFGLTLDFLRPYVRRTILMEVIEPEPEVIEPEPVNVHEPEPEVSKSHKRKLEDID